MNSKPASFQLEKNFPGTFIVQGVLGGVVGGFVAALIAGIAWGDNNFFATVQLVYLTFFYGAIIGMIKATFMFGVVRLTGIQYRAITRVAATSILACLVIAVMGWQLNFDKKFLWGSLISALTVGIPVALLVGSRVKPWELFTFGSMAGVEVDHPSWSRSILVTLSTLPLRFMSIAAIAALLLYFAPQVGKAHNFDDVLVMTLVLSIGVFYPLFSAYMTFRSPRKKVLVVLGILLNFPITLIGLIACREYLERASKEPLIVTMICGSFILAWVSFLIARLSVKSSATQRISSMPVEQLCNLGHECLGSRFAEWQQRVA